MFFLYKSQIESVANRLRSGSINVMGARLAGKSAFISQLSQHLMRLGRRVEILDGLQNQSPTPLTEIREAHPDVEYILIDNLDKLLSPTNELERRAKEISRLEKLVGELWSVIDTQDNNQERKIKLLVTTTGRFFSIVNPWPSFQRIQAILPNALVDQYSNLGTRFANLQLNPWERGWEDKWTQGFSEQFHDRIRSSQGLGLWSKVILRLTGGHPALFSPILEKVAELTSTFAQDPNAVLPVYRTLLSDIEPAELARGKERLLHRKIEEWIDEAGIHPLARMIRRLRDSNDPLKRSVFLQLTRLATSDSSEAPEDKLIRDLLKLEYGLVYEDSAGAFRVAGDYLRYVIQHAPQGRQTVKIEPDPVASRRGIIYVQTSAGEKSIRLNLKKWELFRILYEKRGDLVPLEEILQRTTLTKHAVQNLVTRLRRNELQEVNIEIVNERDRGYRLVLPELHL
jgi:hypothetical protein